MRWSHYEQDPGHRTDRTDRRGEKHGLRDISAAWLCGHQCRPRGEGGRSPGTPCLAEIFAVYGDAVKAPDGSLDRSATARIVFSGKEELSRYNAIIFPYINKAVGERISRLERNGTEFVLLDAPTLFESKADRLCDVIVSVTAPEEMRLTRIMERDHLNAADAKRRMNAQLSEQFFLTHSTYAIRNDRGLDVLNASAGEVVCQILAKFKG